MCVVLLLFSRVWPCVVNHTPCVFIFSTFIQLHLLIGSVIHWGWVSTFPGSENMNRNTETKNCKGFHLLSRLCFHIYSPAFWGETKRGQGVCSCYLGVCDGWWGSDACLMCVLSCQTTWLRLLHTPHPHQINLNNQRIHDAAPYKHLKAGLINRSSPTNILTLSVAFQQAGVHFE